MDLDELVSRGITQRWKDAQRDSERARHSYNKRILSATQRLAQQKIA